MEKNSWDTRSELDKALDKAEGLLGKEGAVLRQVIDNLAEVQRCIERARERKGK